MMMSEIIVKVKSLAENDQSIADAEIARWVDDAINRINISLQANIPTTGGNTTTLVPAFDARFHESLVLFAVAKYRESDSDYNSGQYFMQKFDEMVQYMQRDMNLLPSTRVDNQVQQITVTTPSTIVYNLIMDYGSYFDKVNVYKNDTVVDPRYYRLSSDKRTITFIGLTLATNDKITIVFENNSDLNQPPYQWWSW